MASVGGYAYDDDDEMRTMEIKAPVRVSPAPGPAGAADNNMRTMNLEPPVRVSAPPPQPVRYNYNPSPAPQPAVNYNNKPRPAVPVPNTYDPAPPIINSRAQISQPSHKFALADLPLRIFTIILTAIGIGLIASIPGATRSSTTLYIIAVSVIGGIYSLFQTISSIVRLAQKAPTLPEKTSNWIAYLGDQVNMLLLLSSGTTSAVVAILACDLTYSTYCSQVGGATAMFLITFTISIVSFTISTVKFYTNKW